MRKILLTLVAIVVFSPFANAKLKLEDMNWAMRGANPAHTGSLPWKMGPYFNADTSPINIPDIIEGVSTWGDEILIATQKGKIICMSKGRAMLWNADLKEKPVGVPAICQRAVYVQTVGGKLFKFDAISGVKLLELKVNPEGSTDVTASGKLIIFGGDNQVVCYDTRSNVRKWMFRADKPPQPVAICGAFVFINHQNRLSCLKLFDGKVVWEQKQSDITVFVGAPVVADGMVFISTLDNKLHAYSMFTGKPVWESPTIAVKPVTYDKNKLYVATTAQVVCLDAMNGKRIWASQTFGQPIWSQIAKLENCLLVASKENKIVVLNPENGKQLSSFLISKQVVVDFAVGNDFVVIPDNTYKLDKGNRLCIVTANNQ